MPRTRQWGYRWPRRIRRPLLPWRGKPDLALATMDRRMQAVMRDFAGNRSNGYGLGQQSACVFRDELSGQRHLRMSNMKEITITNLVSLAPSCATEIVNGIVKYQHFIEPWLTSDLAMCHFMAQLAHESAGFPDHASLRPAKITKEGRTSGMCNQETDSGMGAWPDPDDRAGELSGSPRRHPQDRSRRAGFRAATAGSGKIPVGVAVGSPYWTRRKIGELADRDDIAPSRAQ